ncbi:MAG: hypothetical protein Q9169_003808 [Polycauliona sp. 2 TL-2023]
MQDFTDRLNLYTQNTMDATLEKKVTAILTCLLKVIGRCEMLITRGRFKQYLHVVFLVKDEKTKKMLDELNESLDKEQRYVVAASSASQKTTEAGVKSLPETTAETQKGVESTYHLLEGNLATRILAEGAFADAAKIYELADATQSSRSTQQTWANLFVAFYQPLANADRSVMLVVDGLDEASRAVRTSLLGFFKGLLSENAEGARPHIQVAVIGQITLKGDMDFEREEKYIVVSREKNHEDLDRYIEDRLSAINIIKRLGELDRLEARKQPRKQTKPQAPVARRKLKDKISSYADGLFLWAKLLLDQIHDKDYREIEKILSRPPSSLESMVKHVYQRLSAEEDDLKPIKSPNLLLWDKFQGKLASIFELTIPEHETDEEGNVDGSDLGGDLAIDGNEGEMALGGDVSSMEASVEEGDDETVKGDRGRHGYYSDQESGSESDNSDFKLLDDLKMDRGLDALTAGNMSDFAGDHLHAYADWQSITRITYSHLQFREFLVNKKHRDPIDLDIDIERSQLEIVLTCFELLRYGIDAQPNSKYLIDYPCRYLASHLEQVDPASVDIEDRYRILRGIYWLFYDDRGIRTYFQAPTDSGSSMWDDYWTCWLASGTHTTFIRTWLAYADQMSHRSDQDALSWMAAASKDTRELVRPWVQVLAQIWLTKSGFDDEAYRDKSERLVRLMHGLTSLDENGIIAPSLQDFAFYQLDFTKIPAVRLRELANHAQDDSSLHWYTGLAWIYMEGFHYEEATLHFEAALAIDSHAWVPKEGLSRIYGDGENYSGAIQLMEETYNSIPANFTFLGGFLLPYIAGWKRIIGDDEDYTLFAEIGRAYRAEGRPQFVIEALEESLSALVAEKDPYTKIWIQALKSYVGASAAVQKEIDWARDDYGNLLARLCFDAAVSARRDGTNAWPHTKRLKQLATVTCAANTDSADAFDFFGPGYAAMLWGCWLRTYERAEESMWRKTFKVRILDELNMLDDEDPSNDMAGLHSLAITLLHLGDDEAAGAILAILFMPLEILRKASEEDTDTGDGERRPLGDVASTKSPEDGQHVHEQGRGEGQATDREKDINGSPTSPPTPIEANNTAAQTLSPNTTTNNNNNNIPHNIPYHPTRPSPSPSQQQKSTPATAHAKHPPMPTPPYTSAASASAPNSAMNA